MGLLARLQTITEALEGLEITAGLQGQGGAPGPSSDAELVTIGRAHEEGRGVPQRPFMLQAATANAKSWGKAAAEAAAKAARGDTNGAEQAVKALGLTMVADVQQSIGSGQYVALAPSTVARKGSSLQLVDTGQMQASIRAAVVSPDGSTDLI